MPLSSNMSLAKYLLQSQVAEVCLQCQNNYPPLWSSIHFQSEYFLASELTPLSFHFTLKRNTSLYLGLGLLLLMVRLGYFFLCILGLHKNLFSFPKHWHFNNLIQKGLSEYFEASNYSFLKVLWFFDKKENINEIISLNINKFFQRKFFRMCWTFIEQNFLSTILELNLAGKFLFLFEFFVV